MYAGKRRTLRATIVTIFSHMTRDISVFVKCDTIFGLFFLEIIIPQFHSSNFRKVVRQHNEGMVGSMVLSEIYLAFQQWNNFENPLRIDKVIAMSLVYYFIWDSRSVWNFWRLVMQQLVHLSVRGISVGRPYHQVKTTPTVGGLYPNLNLELYLPIAQTGRCAKFGGDTRLCFFTSEDSDKTLCRR